MTFKAHFVFVILILFTNACNKHPEADYSPEEGEVHEISDASLRIPDTLRTSSQFVPHKRKKPVDFDAFQALLEITNTERKTYYNRQSDYTAILISHPDSIQEYAYVTDLFPATDIEQLIFEGAYPLTKSNKIFMRIGTCLRIKFKEKNAAKLA